MRVQVEIAIKLDYDINPEEYLCCNPDMTHEEMARSYIEHGMDRLNGVLDNHFDGCDAYIDEITFEYTTDD